MSKTIIAVNAGPRKGRHETVFPQECAKAYDMGAALAMLKLPRSDLPGVGI